MKKSKTRFQGTSKKMTKEQRGITLVALVITVIIIIILSTVTINVVFGDGGLIRQAKDTVEKAESSIQDENEKMNKLLQEYANTMAADEEIPDEPVTPPEPELPKVEEIKGGDAFDTKTTIEDSEGNKIVVPAGFKIAADSGNTVQQGIVIEDVSASIDTAVQGSQFVWIPVGVFIKDGGTPSNEIILGRYTFSRSSPGTPTLQQVAYIKNDDRSYTDNYTTPKVIEGYYSELATYRVGTASGGLDGLNATAYNLKAWIGSVKENGGYYIGRYEASFASGTSVDNYKAATKVSTGSSTSSMNYSPGTLWNYITQLDASKVAINTYADSTSVKSDLMNSYAWDTAIVFIQECGHTNYANQEGDLINSNLTNTGTGQDEVCKINDMASNIREWTTEYSSYPLSSNASPCTYRGGYYYNSHSNGCTAGRNHDLAPNSNYGLRFPPQLVYVGLRPDRESE